MTFQTCTDTAEDRVAETGKAAKFEKTETGKAAKTETIAKIELTERVAAEKIVMPGLVGTIAKTGLAD